MSWFQSIGIVLLSFAICGLLMLSIYLFEWVALIVWLVTVFVVMTISIHRE